MKISVKYKNEVSHPRLCGSRCSLTSETQLWGPWSLKGCTAIPAAQADHHCGAPLPTVTVWTVKPSSSRVSDRKGWVPFLKWTAELGYDHHQLLEDDCWCHGASFSPT